MQIAILALNLTEKFDAVTFDALHQFRVLQARHGNDTVKLFSIDGSVTGGANLAAGDANAFEDWCRRNPDGCVVFHYCDSRNRFDELLKGRRQRTIIRWHNNTPPWFNLDGQAQGIHAQLGYENLAEYVGSEQFDFWVNSEFTASQLKALGCDSSRISVVFPASPGLNELRTPPIAQKAQKGYELLFVGRVVPHKGHLNCIKLANKLHSLTGKSVRLHFVGKRDPGMTRFNKALDLAALSAGAKVIFHGQVDADELNRLYRECGSFLCMSEHEGFGLPVFEAMRAGLPVIVWATTAFAELMQGHPFAFERFDLDVMVAATIAVHKPDVRTYVANAQESILSRYSHEVIDEQIQDAWCRISAPRSTEDLRSFEMDPEIERAFSANFTQVCHRFPSVPLDLRHDSKDNLVSRYDLQQYRDYFERARGARFAALKPQNEREVLLDPGDFSYQNGVWDAGVISWRGRLSGCLLWGPYVELAKGEYSITLLLERVGPITHGIVKVDVNSTAGVLAQTTLQAAELARDSKISLIFRADVERDWYEFRLWADAGFEGAIKLNGVMLRRTDNKSGSNFPRIVGKDIRSYPARQSHTDCGDVAKGIVNWETGSKGILYEELLPVPMGQYLLDVQLISREMNDSARVICEVSEGPEVPQTHLMSHADMACLRPIKIPLSFTASGAVRFSIKSDRIDSGRLTYAGVVLQNVPQSEALPATTLLSSSLNLFRARAASRRRDFARAVSFYRKGISRADTKPNHWVQFGHALKETGDTIGAEAAYHEGLRLDSGNAEVRLHLAHLYKRMERTAKAKALFCQLLEIPEYYAAAQLGLRQLSD